MNQCKLPGFSIAVVHDDAVCYAEGFGARDPGRNLPATAETRYGIGSVTLSRSAFSARFTQLVGEPPLTYLTRWRMLRATRLLKNEVSVGKIADPLGYASEAAFRKAFKREIGMPPAAYRRLA